MSVDRRLRALLVADDIRLSPVLLDVLTTAEVPLQELVERLLVSRGHLVVLPGTSVCDRLLTALPELSCISCYTACLDLALPDGPGGTRAYCEADTLPFMVVGGPLPDGPAVGTMRGRRLSAVTQPPLAALRRVNPVVEDARIVRTSLGSTLDLILDMDWVVVSVRRSLRIVGGRDVR